mgnify:CR=1 FL=1
MNWKQIIVLMSAFAVSALVLWHDLPIEMPGVIIKVLMLFVKLSVTIAVATFAFIAVAGKRKSS